MRTKSAGGSKTRARRILFGVTTDQSLILLKGFPQHLVALDWDVHVVSSPGNHLDRLGKVPGLTVHEIDMAREPSILRDIRALIVWFQLLRRIRPGIVSVGTPKAGLLGTLAGFATRVPIRVYVLRGLRSETTNGLSRSVLNMIERLACACASQVVCVSPSLRHVALQYKLASASKLQVLRLGSSNGVDTGVSNLTPSERTELRRRYFPDGPRVPVVGFIGRLTQDKGLDTLAGAMRLLTAEGRQGDCIVIGGDDGPASKNLRHQLDTSGWRVVHTGHIDPIMDVTQVMDILCLPSLREGFPNVVLEAAVLGIACIGSNSTGVKDAIVHGETGLIFERGDPVSLAAQLRRIVVFPELTLRLGMAARVHAAKNYGRDDVWAVHSKFYSDLLVAPATGAS